MLPTRTQVHKGTAPRRARSPMPFRARRSAVVLQFRNHHCGRQTGKAMRASEAGMYEVNELLVVEGVEVLEPGPHEVRVRYAANGVCHSDLHVMTGFFFSSRRRHTRCLSDWSSDVCSSDLLARAISGIFEARRPREGHRMCFKSWNSTFGRFS